MDVHATARANRLVRLAVVRLAWLRSIGSEMTLLALSAAGGWQSDPHAQNTGAHAKGRAAHSFQPPWLRARAAFLGLGRVGCRDEAGTRGSDDRPFRGTPTSWVPQRSFCGAQRPASRRSGRRLCFRRATLGSQLAFACVSKERAKGSHLRRSLRATPVASTRSSSGRRWASRAYRQSEQRGRP